MRVLISGSGGFIGGHMMHRFIEEGHDVVGVDIKKPRDWYQFHDNAKRNLVYDLKADASFKPLFAGAPFDCVINLAADMGGMGFLDSHRVDTLHSVDITTNMIRWSYESNASMFVQASSACVYPEYKQNTREVSLKESDAWPADPEPAYGLEKLYGEELCKWYQISYGLNTKAIRLHNVYGPHGTFSGGREKAPSAIIRKVIEAKLSKNYKINIWGDGQQTRSFMYIDDCVEGFSRIIKSDIPHGPINLGSSELVSINNLVSVVEDIAGVKLEREYDLTAPQGVRGRNSDNTLIQELYNWEPSISLREGLEKTYSWIWDQMN